MVEMLEWNGLVATGATLGIVHALTGPDHLSALATLSAVEDPLKSFWYGIQWGLGHSTGLIAVGVVLIIQDYQHSSKRRQRYDTVDDLPEWVSNFFEGLVGVLMLTLGMYGLQKACQLRKRQQEELARIQEDFDGEERNSERTLLLNTKKNNHSWHSHGPIMSMEEVMECDSDEESQSYDDGAPWMPCTRHVQRNVRKLSTRAMAFVVGIIHGLAGPGGVLGVIPAVQLHDWKLATLYLASFSFSSTLAMGGFATCYGRISSFVGKQQGCLEFAMHCFSSSLSLIVGLAWLFLLSIGRLDDVFP